MKTNEVAKLTGVTVRTLQYYDRIGLLKPSDYDSNGYRIYSESDLDTLQQILFFRELDFSLNEIKQIMKSSNYNKQDALLRHKEILIQKRNRLNDLIHLVSATLKGDTNMSFKEFDTSKIEELKEQYVTEVKERWGSTDAYSEYSKKTKDYGSEQWSNITDEGYEIISRFAKIRQQPANSKEAQALVKEWKDHITHNYYNCTKEILSCLGLMYSQDERFRNNIDQYGEGTALFMTKAIEFFCE